MRKQTRHRFVATNYNRDERHLPFLLYNFYFMRFAQQRKGKLAKTKIFLSLTSGVCFFALIFENYHTIPLAQNEIHLQLQLKSPIQDNGALVLYIKATINLVYGRFAVTIKLNELNYLDAAKFYPDKTSYDKVAHYAVFGGSPFVNQALHPATTLRENIISTILNPMSAVYLYASQLLLSDYSVKINAERIFSVIGNGKKRYTEIEDKLDVKKTGNLSKQIKSLTELEIVSRNSPINKIGDNKKATFEINDNLLRFYFTFIYKNASALQVLGAEAFYDEYIGPVLTDFISRRFEGICRDYFSLQVRSGKLKGVRNIGSYYYDDPVHRKNGEFDVTLELADGYAIYEAKYYAQPMTLDEVHHEVQQVEGIKELAVKQLGFIAINGFVEQEKPYIYLDGNDLFADA